MEPETWAGSKGSRQGGYPQQVERGLGEAQGIGERNHTQVGPADFPVLQSSHPWV